MCFHLALYCISILCLKRFLYQGDKQRQSTLWRPLKVVLGLSFLRWFSCIHFSIGFWFRFYGVTVFILLPCCHVQKNLRSLFLIPVCHGGLSLRVYYRRNPETVNQMLSRMNEACMVPWRSLDSRSEWLPRGVSSRAGPFICKMRVAGCGGVEPGSCLQAPPSWFQLPWLDVGKDIIPSYTPGPDSSASGWKSISHPMGGWRGLVYPSIQLAASFASCERAGSSKILKTDSCCELGLMKGPMVHS